MGDDVIGLQLQDSGWRLGPAGGLVEANESLGYLGDRCFRHDRFGRTGTELLAFCRWLDSAGLTVAAVRTEDVLSFLSACRQETVAGRPGPNVVDPRGRRTDRLAPSSVNLRLAAVSGLFEFLAMRDPTAVSPIPKGRPSSWFAAGERSGLLAHTKRRPAPRSRLRVRTPSRCRGPCPGRRPRRCLRICAALEIWRWPG